MRPAGSRSQSGQAIVIVAAMMAVLLGFVGLALDTARLVDARRVLQDSVDAGSLSAAESYQAGKGWAASQMNAVALFEVDNRLSPGESCSPAFGAPVPGTPITVTCSIAGGFTLALTAADNGPAGQAYTLNATRTVSAALMQALGQLNPLLVQASATASANDLALTPAVGALATNNCYGAAGIDPMQLSGSAVITGDATSNGSFLVPIGATPQVAGNVLTRCAPPTNGSAIAYRCWRGGAAPPCPAGDVQGRLLSTNSRLADPRYVAPNSPAQAGLPPAAQVVWNPGTYVTDPQFGADKPRCYFLTPGVYEWQAGLTVNAGMVSNQLRPPDEPKPTQRDVRSPAQFWDANGSKCAGDFILSPGPGSVTGAFTIMVTSVRSDLVGGVSYTRESAPSMCKTISLTSQGLSILISEVPGAASYNIYTTANGGSCSSPFHRFANLGPAVGSPTGTNDSTGDCPATSGASTCSLARFSATYDTPVFPGTTGPAPPDSLVPNSFDPSLPNQSPPRAVAPNGTATGDLANQNSCADASGARAYCRAAVTPGAVLLKVTGTGCVNVKNLPGGDLHIFSGYQYNWILLHEPPTSTCTNTWSGKSNSAALGQVYTPGAGFNLDGTAALRAPTGGIVAATVSVNNSTVTFEAAYAPLPPATRLNN
ncbi:MAG: hypothetical protein NVSMB17_19550 [Candidatus Dormibacteria bacterium]